jgi:hypothetical protein
MLAYEFQNMNETLKMMYDLDELVNSVLANSSCKDLDSIAIFKLMKDKENLKTGEKSIYFNSTEGVRIDLGSTPQFIAYNNKKLTTAQATKSTEDKTRYLHTMGDQLGMATKLYQMKAKTVPADENSDWENTVTIVVTVGILLSVIAFCVI